MLHSMFYGATDGANTAYDYIYNQISTAWILTVSWRENVYRNVSVIDLNDNSLTINKAYNA